MALVLSLVATMCVVVSRAQTSTNSTTNATTPVINATTPFTTTSTTTDASASTLSPSERQFGTVYEWNVIDFAYPSELARDNALESGEYIPENNVISDVKPYANRLYLSLPRMLPGVPATLGWVIAPNNNGRTDPEVEPYPSWDMNEIGNCTALQFVQGLAVDADGVLWVVDSGKIETLAPGGGRVTCPPKIVLLDLKRNGTVLLSHEFTNDVAAHVSNYLNKIAVDDAFGGYAYITDNSGADPGIVVYSRRLDRSWKVREPQTMRASREAVSFAINGKTLNFSIHIDGITLGPYYSPKAGEYQDERQVYYSPLSSYHLYSIPASVLRDVVWLANATSKEIFEHVVDHGVKASQTDGMVMDNQGILYYGLLKQNAVAQWDSFKPFTAENQHIIAQDDYHIQWIDGMGFDEDGHLYVVVNRLHNFVGRQLNANEVNFRILQARTGTVSYVHTGRTAHVHPGGLLVPDGAIQIGADVDLAFDESYNNSTTESSTNTTLVNGAIRSSTQFEPLMFIIFIFYSLVLGS